jgi:hypothetical protein
MKQALPTAARWATASIGKWLLAAAALAAAAFLAFPFVAMPREAGSSSPTARCAGNLRCLHVALEMYAQDYDDHLPAADSWREATFPYTAMERYYRCPAAENPDGYAFNSRLSEAPLEITEPPVPLLFDSSAGRPNAADPVTSFAPRHPGGGLVVYTDGRRQLRETAPAP